MVNELSKQLSKKCKLSKVVNFTSYKNGDKLFNLKVCGTTIGRVVNARYYIKSKNDFIEKLLKILDCRYFWMNNEIVRVIKEAYWE